jgi:hypothetical protein
VTRLFGPLAPTLAIVADGAEQSHDFAASTRRPASVIRSLAASVVVCPWITTRSAVALARPA